MAENNVPLLKVEHLHKEFPTGSCVLGGKFSKKVVSAVNDLSFEIRAGETVPHRFMRPGWQVLQEGRVRCE